MSVWLRRLGLVLLLAVVGLVTLSARAIAEGKAELARSDAAFDEGDLPRAILHARRAATFYVPMAPHVDAAYERLISIARGAEASLDYDAAESAWRAVRSAALETRHVTVPRAAELERADQSLARLAARRSPRPGRDAVHPLTGPLDAGARDLPGVRGR